MLKLSSASIIILLKYLSLSKLSSLSASQFFSSDVNKKGSLLIPDYGEQKSLDSWLNVYGVSSIFSFSKLFIYFIDLLNVFNNK